MSVAYFLAGFLSGAVAMFFGIFLWVLIDEHNEKDCPQCEAFERD